MMVRSIYLFIKILVFSVLISSCGAGWSDVHHDLGDNYHYLGEGTPYNYIFYGKELKSGGLTIDKVIILPNVEDFSVDNKFIVVRQKPSLESIKDNIIYLDRKYSYLSDTLHLSSESSYSVRLKYVLSMADSIVKKDDFYNEVLKRNENFYVIDKINKKVYGPLSKLEFEDRVKKLNISVKLK